LKCILLHHLKNFVFIHFSILKYFTIQDEKMDCAAGDGIVCYSCSCPKVPAEKAFAFAYRKSP